MLQRYDVNLYNGLCSHETRKITQYQFPYQTSSLKLVTSDQTPRSALQRWQIEKGKTTIYPTEVGSSSRDHRPCLGDLNFIIIGYITIGEMSTLTCVHF